MIADDNKITDPNILNILRDPTDSKPLSFSDGFYKLLNEMVSYKKEYDFYTNLQKTGYSTKWHAPDMLN